MSESFLPVLLLMVVAAGIAGVILLKAAPFVSTFRHVPVRAIYGGPSHYRPFVDTWVISWGAVYYKVFETD